MEGDCADRLGSSVPQQQSYEKSISKVFHILSLVLKSHKCSPHLGFFPTQDTNAFLPHAAERPGESCHKSRSFPGETYLQNDLRYKSALDSSAQSLKKEFRFSTL